MHFDKAVDIIIKHEGGYVNDPRDPGGETKYGISKRVYPHLDIANLTIDDAKKIYKKDYWDANYCDELPEKIRLMVFDTSVNQGVGAAGRLLQQSLKCKVDGAIGPKTIKTAKLMEPEILLAEFASHRAVRYSKTKNFDIYGRGWLKRLFSIARDS